MPKQFTDLYVKKLKGPESQEGMFSSRAEAEPVLRELQKRAKGKTFEMRELAPATFQIISRGEFMSPSDVRQPGLHVRVRPSGQKFWCVRARAPRLAGQSRGRLVWATLDSVDDLSLADARTKARDAIARIKAGLPATEHAIAATQAQVQDEAITLETEFAEYLKRRVTGRLRSAKEVERCFNVYVKPELGARPVEDIKRRDIAKLLDKVEDERGPVQADRVLAATLRPFFSWYAGRAGDDYVSPIAPRMARTSTKERARDRILADDEIRLLWSVWSDDSIYGSLNKALLLTAQRLAKVATMKWTDIDDRGIWIISSEAREKGNAGQLVLPLQMTALLDNLREAAPKGQDGKPNCPFIFTNEGGDGYFRGFSKGAKRVAEKVAEALQTEDHKPLLKRLQAEAAKRGEEPEKVMGLPAFTLHDLRRTARSLMSRVGVEPHIAERVLGHVQPGVEGIYDRHPYTRQKGQALRLLDTEIARITRGTGGDNVVPLSERSA